jgi:periplasmic divalent cation tolerance protein
MQDLYLIYMTFADKQEARSIGRVLVEEQLVACVNIFDGINSIYMWQETLQDDSETCMIAKTTKANVSEVINRVKALHSYDCPCVVSWPLAYGNNEFLDWIRGVVR